MAPITRSQTRRERWLPTELWRKIFDYCGPVTLSKVAGINRRFYGILKRNNRHYEIRHVHLNIRATRGQFHVSDYTYCYCKHDNFHNIDCRRRRVDCHRLWQPLMGSISSVSIVWYFGETKPSVTRIKKLMNTMKLTAPFTFISESGQGGLCPHPAEFESQLRTYLRRKLNVFWNGHLTSTHEWRHYLEIIF